MAALEDGSDSDAFNKERHALSENSAAVLISCRLSSSTGAIFFFGSPFFLAAPLDTLDPAAILKLYDFCVFSFDKWQRTARAPLPPPSPFLSSTNLREVTLP